MPFPLSRRATTQILMGAALASGLPAHAAKPKTGAFDLNDPYERLLAYTKVRANLDGTPALYHYHADCFGIVDGVAPKLLFRREGMSAHRMMPYDNRTIGLRYSECNYTLDNAGKPIETWINPFTSAALPVKNQAPNAGLKVLLSPDGSIDTGMKLNPPSSSEMLFMPPVVTGDRIWFTDDILFFRTSADAANFQMSMARQGDLQLTEAITFEASLKDVQNPNITTVAATAIIAAVVPWMPWMGMKTADGKDITGRMLLRYRCRKLAAAKELPAWLAARIEADHPGFIANPKLDL